VDLINEVFWWILSLRCFGGSYHWSVLVDLITEVCRWISCELCICFCHPWEAFCNNPSSWLTSSQLLHKQVMGDISTCLLMLVNKTLNGKEMWSVRFIIMMMQLWRVVSVPAYWHCWTKSKEMWSVSCIIMMNKQCQWPLQTGCMCLVKILLRTTCIENCLGMIECYVMKCVMYIIGCSLHSGWFWIVLALFTYFSCDFYASALLHLILNVLNFLCSDALSLMSWFTFKFWFWSV